ncbi:elongation factor P maturation arginine rhamnosyltransferase EarP [Ramlibacter solisilvae]|uniref:Protein-arginine rhamnosyltransferase n=1 Tax=Ramlibacter tataouinensis TaxID=94132 RepID=A0A127JXT4_9BURK|nr:elongation factor P maturation arginine rhamnosyltransferase EarP [Ramlibacter tataouinensis]AMO24715.1 hypothetical protein UC35_20085 [Ramlibacter tataouinensis]
MLWDIFCKVIDNHGDIGVCWRLAAELARRGERVRLRVDDSSALAWMAPHGQPGVEVMPWSPEPGPGDAVIEAFGCELPPAFQAELAALARARGRQPAWINLEYLTAESFAERSHGLPSPVMSGPAAGLTKRFFYPGFTASTGGLLREQDLARRQAAFDSAAWLQRMGLQRGSERLVSLFCYEPPGLEPWLRQLADAETPTRLLVTAGRAASAVRAALERLPPSPQLRVSWLPLLAQSEFDHLLWSCDANFVRGEDSLVRALWAGRPFVWQIYPQHDDAHHAKLRAFLDWMQAPSGLRRFHEAWSGVGGELPVFDSAAWTDSVSAARARLLAQDELASQLLGFVADFRP